jgi:asparagine synthase (glutamine-hydrolysing)
MCGINGVLRLDPSAPRPDRAEVERVRDAMATRGPDGKGFWLSASEDVAFGHRRLAIIDLSAAGAQPMSSADGRVTVVFNGEIYNYRELREALAGYPFRSAGDTETILALYQRHGLGLLPKLRGMYAFALWDELERRLILARDPHGIKPLYYAADDRVFRFASQVRALEKGGVSSEVDSAGLAGFLMWGSVPEPYTIRKAIRSVPAGHFLEVREGRVGLPEPHASWEPSPSEAAGDVAAAVEDSVRAHLVADVPVGIFLSAGLDSALITALACRHLPVKPTTFTLAFDEFKGTALDEGPGSRLIAEALGTEHVERRLSRDAYDGLWREALAEMDQPSIDGFNVFLMSRFAHEAGLKVVLSGLGGDELFGSYPSFVDVPRWHRRATLLKRIPGIEALWPILTSILVHSQPKAAGFLQASTLVRAYLLKRGLFLPREIPELLGRERGMEGLATYSPIADATRALRSETSPADATVPDPWESVHLMETALYMRNQLLRDADWASMAHSLELRVPLVDVPLTRVARSSHFEPARSEGKKAIAHRAAAELPLAVIERAKSGFMLPFLGAPGNGRRHWGLQARSRALAVLSHFGVDLEAGRIPTARAGRAGSHSARPVGAPRTPTTRFSPNPPSEAYRRGRGERVLVSTLPPWAGGVRTMTQFVLDRLEEGGFQPVLAYYLPYSVDPALSVPAFALGRRKVRERQFRDEAGMEIHEIGTWLPELEFMHYQPTTLWKEVVTSCRFHVAVSGNCLAALPYARLRIPFLNWVATPWRDDRRQREASFNPARRVLDSGLVRPVTTRFERFVLRSGTLLALSEYTRHRLDLIAGRPAVVDVMPNPIEQALFRPAPARVVPWRIGFTGRLNDPRKNIGLLLEAVALCLQRGRPVTAILIGGELLPRDRETLDRLGLQGNVEVHAHVQRDALPVLLQTLDAYVLPSTQEGLCIAALEAMACGCPVVSTRCGGPEEFVRDGETGYLIGFDAREMADAVEKVVADRAIRSALSEGAQRMVAARYSLQSAMSTFWRAFEKAFPPS